MADFWRNKSLSELSQQEWEALCDGCGICCLHKLQDADTGEIFYTDVACEYLDIEKCQCQDYTNRKKLVENCVCLTPDNIAEAYWLPETCAYRRVYEGRRLPEWHPLESGSKTSVHESGNSVCDRAVSETYIHPDEVEERVIQWVPLS